MLKIKRFYMIRHGETVANEQGYVAGFLDTPLTEKGREQACFAKKQLNQVEDRPRVIMHSHLSRARDTAKILNETLNALCKENQSIAERNYGDWAGIPLPAMRKMRDEGRSPPNGETLDDFVQRVIKGLENTLEELNDPVLFVTHAGVIDALLRHHDSKIDVAENCSLLEFVPNGQPDFPWDIYQFSSTENGDVKVNRVKVQKRG